jgi:hypothetical protein
MQALVGTEDVARHQLWPEVMVRRGLELAHDAKEGRNHGFTS